MKKLDKFALIQLAPLLTGHRRPVGIDLKGKELVEFFNRHGDFRDVYDKGLPQIKDGLNTSKKQYAEDRLIKMIGNDNLRLIIEEIVNQSEEKEKCAEEVNRIISPCGYSISLVGDQYVVCGISIKKKLDISNKTSFDKIQNDILVALNKAKISINLAIAWFTNERLYKKLLEMKEQGVDVKVVIYKDGINHKHGVDLSVFDTTEIRGTRGGIMHSKFCIIDNQIVIEGSYNWTDGAEYKNDEHINIIEGDNSLATEYSLRFKSLKQSNN